jgi:microcystin-dependent protein
MKDCDNCDPCPPCESQVPETCEPLPTTLDPRRLVVEDESACKRTIPEPLEVSVLQYDENDNIAWKDGSIGNPIKLPNLQTHTTSSIPKIMVLLANGTVKEWEPSNTGDNFIAYWDGTSWKIGNLQSLLPAGDGVLVKNGGTLSFANGANGDYLQILGGNVQFSSFVAGGIPTGSIIPFPATATPSGWVLCNGAAYGRTALDPSPEPSLFGVIGTTYGNGDGLTTFNVPDLRGVFVRGLDSGRGLDPLRTLGSQQAHSFQSHNHGGSTGSESAHTHGVSGNTGVESANHQHYVAANVTSTAALTSTNYVARQSNSFPNPYTLAGTDTVATIGLTSTQTSNHTHNISITSGAGTAHTHSVSSFGGTETRPVNVATNWIIKL